MTSSPRAYGIKDVALLTGLPASTLRYYESIDLVTPIRRDDSSGHRVYSEADVDSFLALACLAATGMPLDEMRQYLANARDGVPNAKDQLALLREHDARLAEQQRRLALIRKYVTLKVTFWEAVREGDDDAQREIAARAETLADQLRGT